LRKGGQPPLFAYGTLQFPELFAAVAGRQARAEPALLHGYQRRALRGADFPGIRPCAGASVEGVLWCGLDAASWRRIDAFEAEIYVRRRVRVVTEGGERLADTYVLAPAYNGRLGEADWRPERFAAERLEAYLARLAGR
jgi:gamma-glutamylcyclotransferase (GGCT)/AIG2-like uncharacterized protein YtfP